MDSTAGIIKGAPFSPPPPPAGHLAPHTVREPESWYPGPVTQARLQHAARQAFLWSLCLCPWHLQVYTRPGRGPGLQEELLCSLHCVPPIIAIVIGVHASQNQRVSLRGGAEAADTASAQSPRFFHHLLPNGPWKGAGVTVYALLMERAPGEMTGQ